MAICLDSECIQFEPAGHHVSTDFPAPGYPEGHPLGPPRSLGEMGAALSSTLCSDLSGREAA